MGDAPTGDQQVNSVPSARPTVVLALICCLVIGAGLYVADRPAWSAGSSLAGIGSRYLPADGSAGFAAADVDGARTTTFTESARLTTVQANQSVDRPLGIALLQSLGGRLGSPIWRTSTRAVPTGTPSTDTGQPSTNRLYQIGAGVGLLAESDADGIRSYRPALRLLPADPQPGDSWTGSGTVDDSTAGAVHYTSTFRIDPDRRGCLRTSGRIAIGDDELRLTQTWCVGAGITAETRRSAGSTMTSRTVPAPDLDPVTAAALTSAWRWRQPTQWWTDTAAVQTVGPGGRTEPIQGAPALIPPVLTATGLLLRTTQQGQDLVMLARQSATSWRVLRRLHPGGTVTSLVTAGSMIVVGTSERALTGYDDHGLRRWRISTDDIVPSAPAVTGDVIIAATVAGTVIAVDARTGTVGWRRGVGDVVVGSPVVATDRVAVATVGNSVIALDLRTGQPRWQVDRDAVDVLTGSAGQIVVADGRMVHSYAAGEGVHRWRRPLAGTPRQVVPVGGRLLVSTDGNTVGLDPDGRIIARFRNYRALSTDGRSWIGWRAGAADFHDADGHDRDGIVLPELSGQATAQPVGDSDGSVLIGAGWPFISIMERP